MNKALTAHPSTKLSERQTLYVRHRLNGLSAKASALAAGYSNPGSTAFVLERNPKIRDLVDQARIAATEKAAVDKERVMQGFLSAVDAATTATELVQAWRELGKLIGAYEPQKVELSVKIEDLTDQQLRSMSDAELAHYANMQELLKPKRPTVIEDAEFEEITSQAAPGTALDTPI